MTFYVAEIDVYAPAIADSAPSPGHLTAPAAVPEYTVVPESYETVRASDKGYRTLPSDTPSVAVYPPLLAEAFAIDRSVNLDPASTTMAAAWGRIRLANPDGRYDAIGASRNADARAVRILRGAKVWDAARRIHIDPSYGDLIPLFSGLAQPWFLSETSLDIPIRDATYWLDRPLQSSIYGGAGGYDGSADVAGLPKPKTRGGTFSRPIQNVLPVLIDPVNRIYQYNDGPGTVVRLMEGADPTNILFQADTTNLYSGSTSSGSYRTDNSRGLFQLGATPFRSITADVTGEFPAAGAQTTLADIARHLLTEDAAIPAGNVATTTFTATASAYPYEAGVYFGPSQVTGVQAVGALLASAGWKLAPRRDGTLAVFVPRDVAGETPVAALTPATIVTCVPTPVPSTVTPPAGRIRVGYERNWNPGMTDISPAVLAMTSKSFLATQDRLATWLSADVSYRRPSDPPPVTGALLVQGDAQATADRLGALWGVRRRVLSVTVPIEVGLAREIGDVVNVRFPADDLRNGRNGLVVGEQFRSMDSTITLMVLL